MVSARPLRRRLAASQLVSIIPSLILWLAIREPPAPLGARPRNDAGRCQRPGEDWARAARGSSRHLQARARYTENVFETYWTTIRGVEAMDNSYRLLDLTVYGQEMWEDSPTGWPQRFEGRQNFRIDGRPTARWSRLKAGHSDDLSTGSR